MHGEVSAPGRAQKAELRRTDLHLEVRPVLYQQHPFLCRLLTMARLTEKLEKYCANKRIPMPEPPPPKRRGELLSPACLSPC